MERFCTVPSSDASTWVSLACLRLNGAGCAMCWQGAVLSNRALFCVGGGWAAMWNFTCFRRHVPPCCTTTYTRSYRQAPLAVLHMPSAYDNAMAIARRCLFRAKAPTESSAETQHCPLRGPLHIFFTVTSPPSHLSPHRLHPHRLHPRRLHLRRPRRFPLIPLHSINK